MYFINISAFYNFHKDFKHSELIWANYRSAGNSFDDCVDCLKLQENMKEVSEDKQWLYQPFLDDKYVKTINMTYFTNDVYENSLLLGAAFKLCGTPENEIDKYYEAAVEANNKLTCDYRQKINSDLFYGNHELTEKFFDEFGLEPAEPNAFVKVQHDRRTKQAESICPDCEDYDCELSLS